MNKFTLVSMLALSACGSGTLEAPMLKSVEKMDGALMLRWMNMEPACSSIEGERKEGDGEFAVVFSVPGEVNNKHDTGASRDVTYTYRLRCLKNGKMSAYSDEMSMNPVR